MVDTSDFQAVKQVLSRRLLGAALRRGPEAAGLAMTVEAAVANSASNAHAIGIGYKVVQGEVTDQLCIRVHIPQKITKSLIPPQYMIPKEIDGLPTDVVESMPAFIMAAKKKAKAKPKAKRSAKPKATAIPNSDPTRMDTVRPIPGGVSAAQFDVTAGTLSCFCRSIRLGDDSDLVYALSNNHVFANINKATIGDPIYQTSPMDGGIAQDTFARLHRFVHLKLDGSSVNLVDCAIAQVDPGVDIDHEITVVGKLDGPGTPDLRMSVCKHGRTSGYTEGVITDTHYDAIVGMDHTNPNIRAVFNNQLRIERTQPFSSFGLGGDSGSLVVDKSDNKAVGLYFAGPSSGVYGIANHIDAVLSELEIELI